MPILETVRRFIRRHNLLDEGSRVLVAVSGGPDSLCLLGVMQELRFDVRVAHFDHGLREGSALEAERVRQLAQDCRLPVTAGRGDARTFARNHRLSLEEGARRLRYDFLFHRAIAENAPAIATGHIRDDQAETVLLHLLRGAGAKGLSGMRPGQTPGAGWPGGTPGRPVRLIRPLLCLTREQTEEYCRQRGWEPIRDGSNLDPAFRRNRIRLELLPTLRTYNPRIADVLCRLSDIMAAQSDFLEHEVHTRWMPAAQRRGTQELLIPVQMIRDAPCAVQMELVRIVVGTLNPGLRDLAFRHVKQAVEFCLTPPRTGHAELALGLEMEVEGGMIVFRKTPGEPRPVPWEGETLPLPGRLCLQNPDMELEAAVLPAGEAPAVQPRMPRWQAWIDLDRVKLPLHVRTPRAGERWVPLGMEQPVRLANFLSAQHLPLPQRDRWPMVCDMDGIVWIPGMRIGARVRLTETTLRCLALRATTGPEEKNWAVTRKSTEP